MARRDPEDGGGVGPSAGGRAGVVDAVDPERIRAGWQHRFVAAGARADEMIELYRELGFEVAADPVVTGRMVEGCAACFGASADEYRSIYTRRPSSRSEEHTRWPRSRPEEGSP
jgi:hypothetical protein